VRIGSLQPVCQRVASRFRPLTFTLTLTLEPEPDLSLSLSLSPNTADATPPDTGHSSAPRTPVRPSDATLNLVLYSRACR
jgi:hypothetical protein